MSEIVVAVDGPAASGKSSVSRAAAYRLGFAYLDTGAAYRAFALHVGDSGVDFDDEAAVVAALDSFDYMITTDPNEVRVSVGGADVTATIREPRVSAVVSSVARVGAVRESLNSMFRGIMAADAAPGIVVEGRDITTVVAPDAPVRILLTASEEVRAARRRAELAADAAGVGEALRRRDAADSKTVDFMSAAPGVATLDSSELNFEQTVEAFLELVSARL